MDKSPEVQHYHGQNYQEISYFIHVRYLIEIFDHLNTIVLYVGTTTNSICSHAIICM